MALNRWEADTAVTGRQRLLLLSEVSANVNLPAFDHSEVTFDIAGFTLGLLFVSFTKALHNADFNCNVIHFEYFKRV